MRVASMESNKQNTCLFSLDYLSSCILYYIYTCILILPIWARSSRGGQRLRGPVPRDTLLVSLAHHATVSHTSTLDTIMPIVHMGWVHIISELSPIMYLLMTYGELGTDIL